MHRLAGLDRDYPANLERLRIGLLTASASRLGGGVFEAVAQQAAMIRECGGEAPVFALRDYYSELDAERFAKGTVRHLQVAGPAAIGFAPGLIDTLLAAELDCLHLHGVWMYPSHAGAAWAVRSGRPYVISPHGMLDRWITGRGRTKKLAARIAYERRSWGAARAFHALTAGEADDIARETGCGGAIVIPNGGPPARDPPDRSSGPSFVYIGRIHPKKNLAALIGAWRRCGASMRWPGARLTIAGWGEERHVAALRRSLRDDEPSVSFVGPVYGERKRELLESARFVVLASLSEGLPMAILEAWAAAVPTIMSAACQLESGFHAGAAIECGTSEAAITASLETALAMPEHDWRAMSRAAHALAGGRFAAAEVREQWVRSYRALIAGERAGTAA